MKAFTKKLMTALTLCAVLAGHATAEDAEAKAQDADAPEAYVGQLPDNDKLEVLAEHKVIATFEGVKFRRCMGATGRCPDKCGSSGNFANFKITDYLHHKKLGKYGEDKYESYMAQISDFHRKPQGDPALVAYVETLEKGDLVVIEWKHLYGEVSPGLTSPVRPLILLKKIDKDQAKQLIDEAAAAERAEKERGE